MRLSEHLANVLTSSLSLLALWIILVGPYRWYRTDLFRQRLFALRDELFDLAADGHLAYDAPAYAQLRTTINGYIRFAERFGVSHLVLSQLFVSDATVAASSFSGYTPRWRANTTPLAPHVREALNEIVQRVHVEVAVHVFVTSPISSTAMLVIIGPLMAIRFALHAGVRLVAHAGWRVISGPVTATRRLLRDLADSADTTAYIAGTA